MLRKLNHGIRVGLLGLALCSAYPTITMASADGYVADAKQALAKGKVKEAVIQLKNALKDDPSSTAARLMLGNLYLRMNNAEGAEKELSRAGRLGAPKDEWMVGLAQAKLMRQDFKGLLEEIHPDQTMSKVNRATVIAMRGNAHIAQKNQEEAALAYDEALGVHPSNPMARLGKARLLVSEQKFDEAAAQFTEVLKEYPDHVETRLARGDLYRGLKKSDDAIADYAEAIRLAPNNIRGYMGRALSLIEQQKLDEAEKDVNLLAKRAAKLPISSYLRGLLAFQRKDFDTASEHLQLVLRASPDNLQAQLLYGISSYARGDYRLADDYLSRVMSILTGNQQVAKLLGAVRIKLKEPERAVAVLEPLLEAQTATGPDGKVGTADVQTYALLGSAYIRMGDNEKGAQMMEKAVELEPDHAMLRTQLAASRIVSGNAASAIPELESAVNLGQDLIQADVLLVLSHLSEKNYDKAMSAATELEKRMPDSAIPVNLTGLAMLAQNQHDQARERFNKALKIDPDFLVARMNLARTELAAKQPEQARKHYLEVVKKSPKHLSAMLGLAALETAEGRDKAAEDWLVKANAANPTALQPVLVLAEKYLKRNQGLKANNLLSGLKEDQVNIPGVLRLKGLAQLQSGDFTNAKASFERLSEVLPESIEVWFQLGRAQAASGDHRGARDSFAKAIELDTEFKEPIIWVGLGELELRDKNWQEALNIAKKMQEKFPKHAMSYEIEAAAHRGRGKIQDAIKAIEKAVRVDGTTKRVNLFAHILSASGNAPKAVYMLEEWLEENPDDVTSLTTIGMLHQQMGKFEPALAAYEKIIDLGSENPVVLNNMAWLYLEKNQERALRLSQQAYEIAPERAEIVDTHGWVLFKLGRYKDALNILQQALVLAPQNPEISLHVAQALHHQGRDAEARPLLERVVNDHALTPHAAPARRLLKKLQ